MTAPDTNVSNLNGVILPCALTDNEPSSVSKRSSICSRRRHWHGERLSQSELVDKVIGSWGTTIHAGGV